MSSTKIVFAILILASCLCSFLYCENSKRVADSMQSESIVVIDNTVYVNKAKSGNLIPYGTKEDHDAVLILNKLQHIDPLIRAISEDGVSLTVTGLDIKFSVNPEKVDSFIKEDNTELIINPFITNECFYVNRLLKQELRDEIINYINHNAVSVCGNMSNVKAFVESTAISLFNKYYGERVITVSNVIIGEVY